MLSRLHLEHILFLDIETVPETESFVDLHDTKQQLWELKSQYQRKDDYTAEEFYDRAGIWAEFGKIICISVGYFSFKGEQRNFRVTSFYGDEVKILKDFKNLLISHFSQTKHLLCAHNGKEFDFPYIARRMIINQIELPYKLNLFGKKPWEVPHLHWVREDLKLNVDETMSVKARIRYRQPLQEATLYKVDNGLFVEFEDPQSAITEGQFVAWYLDDELVGSGVIS